MPLIVPCDELEPGMMLYEPIVARGMVMMQSGHPLSQDAIDAIARRFPGISVRVADPVLDGVVEFEDDRKERESASKAQQSIADSMTQIQNRFAARASLGSADFMALKSAVAEVMAYLKANPSSTALLTRCLDSGTYLSTHTGNVFYLSMLLGSAVLDYVVAERKRQTDSRSYKATFAMDLTPLGLGAMAMDLGMIPLQSLFESDKPLTAEDKKAIQQHPIVGAEMLPESLSSIARMIVRTHHENFDGSGYPNKLARKKLHVFTRIVRIADAYDAAVSDRVFKKAKSPARVIWEMTVGPYRRFYDKKLMKAFARLIQPFPIGSKLRLEDGRYAVVTKYNRRKPFEPTAVIAYDANNETIPQQKLEGPVELKIRGDVRIKSFRGEDLSFIHATDPGGEVPAFEDRQTLLETFRP